jgi:pimeloyl-ACP methyl ester carboxylesterase
MLATPPVLAQEVVTLQAADGAVLYADVTGEGERAVVLAHGGRWNKASWAPQAGELAAAGFRVLALDFRGYGHSTGPGQADPLSAPLELDILAAVRYLRRSGSTSVAVVGASMGGSAAADAAVREPGAIDRLVLLGSPPGKAPEALSPTVLFIVARGDTAASGTPRLARIREQYELVPAPKEMVVLEGAAHAQAIFQTDQGTALMNEILRFLRAAPAD